MNKKNTGFSLIEIVVVTAVLLIFLLGTYSGLQFVFKLVYQSRLRVLENNILNEQIEVVRNMSFYDVGIENGNPDGVLQRTIFTSKNNIDFEITRTVRNIDDPYDGQIGGEPNDVYPADYKFVQIDIICTDCQQKQELSASTFVAPRFLEGDPEHGALFVEVLNSEGDPVSEAEVYIQSDSSDPTIDMVDTTDNDGMLRLLDLGAGIDLYNIEVSKAGFVSDRTYASSTEILDPIKPPATVVAQDAREISFSIDQASSFKINTTDANCLSLSSVSANILGTKLIASAPVFRVNQDFVTDFLGEYDLSNLVWDNYAFHVYNYDLLGTIPATPLYLSAGVNQDVKLVLGPNTDNSIVLVVQDSATNQPVSGASVRIDGQGIDQTKSTGVGFVRQGDWSGGSGQQFFVQDNKYWSDDGKIENSDPAGSIKLKKVGESYVSSGFLESSVFDLGTEVNLVNLIWEPLSQAVETGDSSVRWQLAGSTTSTPEDWNFVGPDNTATTYFDSSDYDLSGVFDNNRYFRYRLFLNTDSTTSTPTISDVFITYTTQCTPPGQVYFGDILAGDYVVSVNKDGYLPTQENISVSDDMIFSIDLNSL